MELQRDPRGRMGPIVSQKVWVCGGVCGGGGGGRAGSPHQFLRKPIVTCDFSISPPLDPTTMGE